MSDSQHEEDATFFVAIAYPLGQYAQGSLDDQIEAVAPDNLIGCGSGFGMRDLAFEFAERGAAQAALDALRALDLPGVEISYDFPL